MRRFQSLVTTMTIIAVLVILSVTSVLAQDYIVDPLSVKKCETSSGSDDVEFDLELESKDGAKYLQMKVKLNRTVNDQCTFRTTTDIKAGSDFTHYMDADGSACESISNMMEPAWKRLKEELDPPLKKDCEFKAGTYTLTDYQVNREEVDEPIPAEGYFRTKTYLTCEGIEIACLETEFVVSEVDSE